MSSLKFGLSCGNVKTQVSKKAVNVQDSISQVEESLKACTDELQRMEEAGMKGGFSPDAPKPTCDSFVDNYLKLVAEQQAMTQVQAKMVRSVKGADVSALQAKKLVHAKQIEHFRGMLARQMTTKIWTEPK